MDLDSAIKHVYKVISSHFPRRFDKLYRLTTENINGYIKEFNFYNKSLFTVGSSGDQAINANMYGCNSVTLIDINPLARYYVNMKRAAILAMDYSSFIKFIHKNKSGDILSKKDYSKIRDFLRNIDIEAMHFWDYMYEIIGIDIIKEKLFHNFDWEYDCANIYNSYLLNKDNYNLSKSKISNLKINFINCNMLKIDKIVDNLDKVDNIMLSNIYDYNNSILKVAKFRKSVNYLIDLLNDDGKMLISYLYNTTAIINLAAFASNNIVNEYDMKHFRGILGIDLNENILDTAIIYEKKKHHNLI